MVIGISTAEVLVAHFLPTWYWQFK